LLLFYYYLLKNNFYNVIIYNNKTINFFLFIYCFIYLITLINLIFFFKDNIITTFLLNFIVHSLLINFLLISCIICFILMFCFFIFKFKIKYNWEFYYIFYKIQIYILLLILSGVIWGSWNWGLLLFDDLKILYILLFIIVLIYFYDIILQPYTVLNSSYLNSNNLLEKFLIVIISIQAYMLIKFALEWWDGFHQTTSINIYNNILDIINITQIIVFYNFYIYYFNKLMITKFQKMNLSKFLFW
jgi:hypothetical protein